MIGRRALAAAAGLLILCGWAAAGCAEAVSERLNLAEGEPVTVGFVVHGPDDDPFWEEVHSGADAAAIAFDASVIWFGNPDLEERRRQIRELTEQQVQVLVVSLDHSDALKEEVGAAGAAGITVYVVNEGAEHVAAHEAAAFFGQLDTAAGLAVGERLLGSGAENPLCVLPDRDDWVAPLRCHEIEIDVGAGSALRLDMDAAETPVEQIIARLELDPEIDAVITMTPWIVEHVEEALAEARAGGREFIHGVFDVDERVLDGIEAGTIQFAVAQQGWLQGYLPVAYARLDEFWSRSSGDDLAAALLQWTAGGAIYMGPAFIDAENVERVRAAGLLQ